MQQKRNDILTWANWLLTAFLFHTFTFIPFLYILSHNMNHDLSLLNNSVLTSHGYVETPLPSHPDCSMCRKTWACLTNDFPQCWHLKSFLSWTFRMWASNTSWVGQRALQCLHPIAVGSLECSCLQCCLKLALNLNFLLHSLQTWDIWKTEDETSKAI